MAKKILNVFTTVILVAVIILAVLLVGVRVFGFRPFAVLSPSMTPQYKPGDLVYTKAEDFGRIKKGDVITFVVDKDLTTVTHRVVGKDTENHSFTTKGDANNIEDSAPVIYENVIGTVRFSIPLLGYLSIFLTNSVGRYTAISLAALLILITFLPDIFKLFKAGKKEDTKS